MARIEPRLPPLDLLRPPSPPPVALTPAARLGPERWRTHDRFGPPAPVQDLIPTLSAGPLSPLMKRIVSAVQAVAHEGGVPPALILTRNNRVSPDLLVGGPLLFDTVREGIACARHEVLFQDYDWQLPSYAVDQLLKGLQELEKNVAREAGLGPVRVRFLVDQFESLFDPTKERRILAYELLEEAIQALGLDPALVDVQVSAFCHRGLGSLHSKTLVIDGERALVMSANPDSLQKLEIGFWVEGPSGSALREEFRDAWRESGAEGSFPSLPSGLWSRTVGKTPILIASRRSDGRPHSNEIAHPLGVAYLTAIRHARHRVRIITPNLNDDAIVRELRAALARGVRIELVLCRDYMTLLQSMPLQGGANGTVVKRLLRFLRQNGLPADRLTARWYSEDGTTPTDGVDITNHAKYLSVDGQLIIAGSSNLDTQSLNHSREVNAVIDSTELARRWDQQFFEPVFERGIGMKLYSSIEEALASRIWGSTEVADR
jgi:phosphatidylserine/phosphatidylglycerophosphate/cardiolipin synthase-like enzyme